MGYQRNQISRIHRDTNNTESQESSRGTITKTWDPDENTLIQWGAAISQKSLAIKSLYDQGRGFFHLLVQEV